MFLELFEAEVNDITKRPLKVRIDNICSNVVVCSYVFNKIEQFIRFPI